MTASSARKSSASDALIILAPGDLHIWLCHRQLLQGTGEFLRAVLSRYTGAAPADLQFSRGLHGKPSLAYPPGPFAFNVSDSGEWLALAVSGDAAVGIDIEYCDPGRDPLALAARFYSPAELACLRSCEGRQRLDRFHDFWTLKEAHIKAAGGSLAGELESTAFDLSMPATDSETAAPGMISALAPAAGMPAWYCLLQPVADYRVAICCLGGGDVTPSPRLFELGPAGGVHRRALRLLAASSRSGKIAAAVRP